MHSAGKRGARRADEESSSSVSSDEEPSRSVAAVTRAAHSSSVAHNHAASSASVAAMNQSNSFNSSRTSPLSRLHEAKRNAKHKRQLNRGVGGRFRSKVEPNDSSSQHSNDEDEPEVPRGRGRSAQHLTDSSSIPIDVTTPITIPAGDGSSKAARAAAPPSESDGSEDENPRKRQRVTRSSNDPHPAASASSSGIAVVEESKEADEDGAEEEEGEEEEDEEDEEAEDEAMQDEKKSVAASDTAAMEEATTNAKSSKPAQRRRRRRKAPLGLKRRKNVNRATSGAVESDESDTGAAAANRSVVLPRFRCVNRVREGHGNPLYFVAFNCVDARHADVFASAGANRVTVYRALAGGAVDPMQLYVDEDPREYIYALAWSIDLRTGSALLLMAGQNGIIKIIDCHTRRLVRRLLGHGSSINELKLHPHDLNILLSVSKDMSVRLWNIQSGDCIAMFAGEQGHRDEVLSADFHQSGERIVSSGMDHAIMIWEIDARIKQAMKQSYAPSHLRPAGEPFSTVFVQFPLFSTNQVHQNYVDHVKFLGDFILSKSTEEKIVMWKVRNEAKRKAPHRLMEYTFSDCDIWYIRFAMDMPNLQYIAVGNKSGAIFVWSADEVPPCAPRKLVTPQSQRAIRCVAFSSDAKILIAACEDGSLFRWDQLPPAKNNDTQSQEKMQQSLLDEAQQIAQGRQESGGSM